MFNHSPRIVTNGLVLCLDAANPKSYGGSGTVWKDLSGNGNNGTLTNGPTFDSGNGGSIVFDGTDDRVLITSPFGDVDWSTIPWTFSSFMKLDTTGNRALVCLNSANNTHYVVNNVFFTDKKSYWYFIKNSVPTQTNFTQTIGVFDINEIFHFTMVYNGLGLSTQNIFFYKNGTQLTTSSGGSAAITNSSGIQLGGTNYRLDGNVYEFMLYNRALTPQEIQQNFNATKNRFGL
jgi:hypothetical protein